MTRAAFVLLWVCFMGPLWAVKVEMLNKALLTQPHPFQYDLHPYILSDKAPDAEVLVCLHGMRSDYRLADILKTNPAIPYHIVSFNFPDNGPFCIGRQNPLQTKYGTIDEVLPALYILKRLVIDGNVNKLHLYGFSAGGAAIINTLAVLNTQLYPSELQKIGIGFQERKMILDAIQRGNIILEVPLKSFDEVAEVFGSKEDVILAARAKKNRMTPIVNLQYLQGLELSCFVCFSNPDEGLGNRDDRIYIQRLRSFNPKGKTISVESSTGHTGYHPELWHAYQNDL